MDWEIARTEPDRVRAHTRDSVNERIDRQTDRSLRFWSAQPPEAITGRIAELEREWDIERYLEATASSLALSGIAAGLAGRRKGLFLSATVLAFLFQHAVQGWCPPLALFRSMGIRTRREIDREKYGLKAARGDFEGAANEPFDEE